MRRLWLFFLPISLLSFSVSNADNLIQFSDLQYLGAFRMPDISGPDVNTINFGGNALGYNPGSPGSLFISCFDPGATIAEISIPNPAISSNVSSLPRATLLQPCSDPTTGGTVSVGNDSNGYRIGGMLVSGGKLISTKYAFYDANGSQTNALFVKANTNLSQANAAGAFALGNAPNIGFQDGWMAPIPTAYQGVLKAKVASGNDGLNIVSRTSWGPDAFSWDPAQLTNPSVTVASTPLFYYTGSHPMLGSWGDSRPIDNSTVYWNGGGSGYHGVVIPDGTRSILFFGAQGQDPKGFCYGEGTSDPSLDRKPVPNEPGVIYCYDPDSSSKGGHDYPYQYQIMAYDLNDLAAVAAGTKNPWDLKPYAVWPLTSGIVGMNGVDNMTAGGAVYDPVLKRIYFSGPGTDTVASFSNLPLVYVWQVNTPGASGNTYYVSPAGNDSNNGSSSAPWAHIQAFGNVAHPGDTLIIRAGSYTGAIFGWDGPGQGQYSQIAGTASQPITIKADPNAAAGTVIINSRNSKTAIGLDLEPGCDYVNITGLTITNPGGSITKAGMKVAGSTGNQILGNTVNGVGGIGGIFVDTVTNVLIANNTLINTQGTGTTGHGMYVSGSSSGVTVKNNLIHDNQYVGIHVNGDVSEGLPGVVTNLTIDSNFIYSNGQNGINADGIQNSTIKNNLIYGNDRNGIELYQIDALGGSINNKIINNTILGNGASGSVAVEIAECQYDNQSSAPTPAGCQNPPFDTSTGNIAFNNILIGNSGPTRLVSGSDLTLSSNITSSSPALFVNASANNYQLASNSPALNSGVASFGGTQAPSLDILGVLRPQGTAWDIGAYESTSSLPIAPLITTQPQNKTVNAGSTATFSIVASGVPVPTYQWELSTDGGTAFNNIPSATSSSYTTPALALSDDGNKYRCVASNSQGNATSNAATLTVNPPGSGQTIGPAGGTLAFNYSGTTPTSIAQSALFTIVIPPGAFQTLTTITLSSPHSTLWGSAQGPSNNTTYSGPGVEITSTQQPNSNSSITLKVNQLTGVDTSGSLELGFLNSGRFIPLPSSQGSGVTATTNHFTVFALAMGAGSGDLGSVLIYPNPFRPSQGHTQITFANLPANSTLKVYTLTGDKVTEFNADSTGIAFWDANSSSGNHAASGVYFVLIEGNGQKKTFKVAVER